MRKAMDYITLPTPSITFLPADSASFNFFIIKPGQTFSSELGMSFSTWTLAAFAMGWLCLNKCYCTSLASCMSTIGHWRVISRPNDWTPGISESYKNKTSKKLLMQPRRKSTQQPESEPIKKKECMSAVKLLKTATKSAGWHIGGKLWTRKNMGVLVIN